MGTSPSNETAHGALYCPVRRRRTGQVSTFLTRGAAKSSKKLPPRRKGCAPETVPTTTDHPQSLLRRGRGCGGASLETKGLHIFFDISLAMT